MNELPNIPITYYGALINYPLDIQEMLIYVKQRREQNDTCTVVLKNVLNGKLERLIIDTLKLPVANGALLNREYLK